MWSNRRNSPLILKNLLTRQLRVQHHGSGSIRYRNSGSLFTFILQQQALVFFTTTSNERTTQLLPLCGICDNNKNRYFCSTSSSNDVTTTPPQKSTIQNDQIISAGEEKTELYAQQQHDLHPLDDMKYIYKDRYKNITTLQTHISMTLKQLRNNENSNNNKTQLLATKKIYISLRKLLTFTNNYFQQFDKLNKSVQQYLIDIGTVLQIAQPIFCDATMSLNNTAADTTTSKTPITTTTTTEMEEEEEEVHYYCYDKLVTSLLNIYANHGLAAQLEQFLAILHAAKNMASDSPKTTEINVTHMNVYIKSLAVMQRRKAQRQQWNDNNHSNPRPVENYNDCGVICNILRKMLCKETVAITLQQRLNFVIPAQFPYPDIRTFTSVASAISSSSNYSTTKFLKLKELHQVVCTLQRDEQLTTTVDDDKINTKYPISAMKRNKIVIEPDLRYYKRLMVCLSSILTNQCSRHYVHDTAKNDNMKQIIEFSDEVLQQIISKLRTTNTRNNNDDNGAVEEERQKQPCITHIYNAALSIALHDTTTSISENSTETRQQFRWTKTSDFQQLLCQHHHRYVKLLDRLLNEQQQLINDTNDQQEQYLHRRMPNHYTYNELLLFYLKQSGAVKYGEYAEIVFEEMMSVSSLNYNNTVTNLSFSNDSNIDDSTTISCSSDTTNEDSIDRDNHKSTIKTYASDTTTTVNIPTTDEELYDYNDCRPTTATYNMLLMIWCKCGDHDIIPERLLSVYDRLTQYHEQQELVMQQQSEAVDKDDKNELRSTSKNSRTMPGNHHTYATMFRHAEECSDISYLDRLDEILDGLLDQRSQRLRREHLLATASTEEVVEEFVQSLVNGTVVQSKLLTSLVLGWCRNGRRIDKAADVLFRWSTAHCCPLPTSTNNDNNNNENRTHIVAVLLKVTRSLLASTDLEIISDLLLQLHQQFLETTTSKQQQQPGTDVLILSLQLIQEEWDKVPNNFIIAQTGSTTASSNSSDTTISRRHEIQNILFMHQKRDN